MGGRSTGAPPRTCRRSIEARCYLMGIRCRTGARPLPTKEEVEVKAATPSGSTSSISVGGRGSQALLRAGPEGRPVTEQRFSSPKPARSVRRELYHDVYAEPYGPFTRSEPVNAMALITYRDALNQALREELRRDPPCSSWRGGGRLQGAYKVSKGCSRIRAPAHRRYADYERLFRCRRRRRHGGPAPHHRDDDVELLSGGHRPDRQRRAEDALHVGRPVQDPMVFRDRAGRPPARGAALPVAGGVVASVPGLKVVAPSTHTTPRAC